MNKLLIGATVAVSLTALLTACSDTFNPSDLSDREGGIMAAVEMDKSVASPWSRASKADAAPTDNLTESDLILKLTSTSGGYTQQWNYGEMPAVNRVPVGTYLLEAYSGSEDAEGVNAPYYYGSTTFQVYENRQTEAGVTARLANSIVTIELAEAVKAYFESITATIVTASGKSFTFDEALGQPSTPIYVKPGQFNINLTLVKKGETTSYTITPTTHTAEACNHYHVAYNLGGDGGGAADIINVTFSEQLADEEFEINISDDILSSPAPAITLAGYDAADGGLSIVEGDNADGLAATIMAQGGLSNLIVTTSSASLLAQGWPAEVDLIKGDGAALAKVAQFGLARLGTEAGSRMAHIDLSNVVSHIKYIAGGDNTTTFNIIAKDAASKASEPVAITVNTDLLRLEIVSVQALEVDRTELIFDILYNGRSTDDIRFEIENERGTTTEVAPISITPAARGGALYTVVLPVPAEGIVVLKASAGDNAEAKFERTIKRSNIKVDINDADVFATHATVTISDPESAIMLSANGGAYTEVAAVKTGKSALITGLTPGTAYKIKATLDDISSAEVAFTTEQAAQLPNAGLDEWWSEKAYGKKLAWVGKTDILRWFPNESGVSYWATRNPLTTAQNSGTTCYYTSYSSTLPVNGVNGKAAEICTTGYGEGSTFTNPGGINKHTAIGMLFMGTLSASSETEETITYGQPFASRPASFSFQYKFAPVNNESFKAYVVVENRDNGVVELGRGELVSGEKKDSFVPATVTINYSDTSKKATHMYIVFLSSTSDSPQVNEVKGSDGALAGYGDSRRVGSVLTVDEITLNY